MLRASAARWNRVVRINAGGRLFAATDTVLTKYPNSRLAAIVRQHLAVEPQSRSASKGVPLSELCVSTIDESNQPTLFADVDPDAFAAVLNFLRSGDARLPTTSEPARAAVVWQMRMWGLLGAAFPPTPVGSSTELETDAPADGKPTSAASSAEPDDENGEMVVLPDILVVQACDHLHHDQGAKRHAMTITFGSDGFQLKSMCKTIRKDLKTLLTGAHWQVYQTHERTAFFVCSKINSGSADLLNTSVMQRTIQHVEQMGYTLASSYVTLSPDAQHVSVRLLIHNFIFRRVRLPQLEDDDLLQHGGGDDPASTGVEDDEQAPPPTPERRVRGRNRGGAAASSQPSAQDEAMEEETHARREDDDRDATYRNFEPPSLGPSRGREPPAVVPRAERVRKLWPTDDQ